MREAVLPSVRTLRVHLEDAETLPCEWISPARFPALRRLSLSSRDRLDPAPWSGAAIVDQLDMFDLAADGRDRATDRHAIVDRLSRHPSPPAAGLLVMASPTRAAGILIVLPEAGELSIGRSDVVPMRLLTRPPLVYTHAQFRCELHGWLVRESRGLSLNRRPVERTVLRSDDSLALGPMELRFLEGELEDLATELRRRFALDATARISPASLEVNERE